MSQKSENSASSSKSWQGTNISDICKGRGPWSFAITPMMPSKYHWVLFEMPVDLKSPPKPHVIAQPQLWNDDHVRMPYSESNLFPVKENDVDIIKPRWDLIKQALSKPITNSREFEAAVHSYNTVLPKFDALHYYFEETMEEEVASQFFSCLLPDIVKLALRLPELLPSGIPLLQQNHNRSLSLSQLQIACLLANGFLCTFPWKKTVALTYPGANFVRLFAAYQRPKRQNCVCEKLKCIFNYFRRVTRQNPIGVVTFERKFVHRTDMPRWDKQDQHLGNTSIHISSAGTIEDGQGFLQVDFANKNVGGGVLGYGCVQEEIRFVICPELIVSRLFMEQLSHGEAVIITGVERFNNYTGYGDSFEWSSNCEDDTPFDVYGRRRTSICVIDAIRFNRSKDQFNGWSILREANKAYVGFFSREKKDLAPVATGNWGCGAFKGSKQLKSLIQLMACCVAGRNLVYYSFGDENLREDFYKVYLFLANHRITVAQLWSFLSCFCSANLGDDKLFAFIQQAYFDSKKQTSIKNFFPKTEIYKNQSCSSRNIDALNLPKKAKTKDFVNDNMEIQQFSSDEDVIESSQPELTIPKRIIIKPKKKLSYSPKSPVTDLSGIFDLLDQSEKSNEQSHNNNLELGNAQITNKLKPKVEKIKDKLPTEDLTGFFDMLDGKISKPQDPEDTGQQLSVLLSPELNKLKENSWKIKNDSLREVVVVQNDIIEKMDADTTDETIGDNTYEVSKSSSSQSKISKRITDYFVKKS